MNWEQELSAFVQHVRANPTGWMNEDEMFYWIENDWIKRARLSNPVITNFIFFFSTYS
jgi:hypothetical protein